MHDKDKHDAPKHAPAHKQADKDEPKTPEPAPFKARMSHEEEVGEGVEAAKSHRQTIKDVVEAEHAPFKAPPPHPLVDELVKLADEVATVAKAHKEKVLDLRDKLQNIMYKAPADLSGQSSSSVQGAMTKVEEGINMLDPDCSARAPG